jgi:hypothetical protein
MSCSQDEIDKQVQAALAKKLKNSDTAQANDQMMAMMRSMTGKDSAAMQSMFQNVSSMLTCDSACQRRKKADELRRAWKAAEESEKKAPTNTSDAEKQYYVFTQGVPGYEKMLLQRYTKKAEAAKSVAQKSHKELLDELTALLADYTAETITLKRMKELLRVRLDENKALKLAIDQDISAVETNDRRVVYEDWAKGWLGTVGKSLIWLYIIVAATFVYKSSFIKSQGYKTIKGWLMIVALVIYPFILKYFSLFIWYLSDQIQWFLENRAPRDVFTSDNM